MRSGFLLILLTLVLLLLLTSSNTSSSASNHHPPLLWLVLLLLLLHAFIIANADHIAATVAVAAASITSIALNYIKMSKEDRRRITTIIINIVVLCWTGFSIVNFCTLIR